MNNFKYKAISLFAGAGGDTQGLEDAGIEVVSFVEFDKKAKETHLINFPNSKLIGEEFKSDITKIPDSDFLKYKGKIDIIFAGFPCQGFSHAGKKDPNDKRNQLFHQFARVVKLIEPR
jgi:DNA (cytosine-5)-methyltransferase 1